MDKRRKRLVITAIITGALTVVITGIMDFCLFPRIEAATAGMKSFDLCSFGYTFEYAKEFLSRLGDYERSIYLNIQLPLDFVYPLIYTAFFVSMMLIFSKKAKFTLIFPIFLFVADYAENSLICVMLRSEELSLQIASAASAATIIKTIIMYITALIIVLQIIAFIVSRKKQKAAGT